VDQEALESCCPSVTVVIPVYRGEDTLPALISRCDALQRGACGLPAGVVTELIFVCDDPIDDSESVLRVWAQSHSWIQVVSLARNNGQHLATAVGMLYSSGDWILTIDEDLQHPPELLGAVLEHALRASLDVLYVKSNGPIHEEHKYRDITSVLAKRIIRAFTRDDYSHISSFRLIRGEVGRSLANSVDRFSYLDAVIYSATGQTKRDVYYASYFDSRPQAESGYDLSTLIRHYGRFLTSVEFSGLRSLLVIAILVVLPLFLLFGIYCLIAFKQGVQQVAPGWLSLFSLVVIANIMIIAFGIYFLKILSSMYARIGALPAFLVIDRSVDKGHLKFLEKYKHGP